MNIPIFVWNGDKDCGLVILPTCCPIGLLCSERTEIDINGIECPFLEIHGHSIPALQSRTDIARWLYHQSISRKYWYVFAIIHPLKCDCFSGDGGSCVAVQCTLECGPG